MRIVKLHAVSAYPEKNGSPIYVNLANSTQIHRWPKDNCTYIIFVGNPQGVVKVSETPEEILALDATA